MESTGFKAKIKATRVLKGKISKPQTIGGYRDCVRTVNGIKPDENGNVEIQTGACLPDEKIAELMSALQ